MNNKSIRYAIISVLSVLIILSSLSSLAVALVAIPLEPSDFSSQAVKIDFDNLPDGTFVGNLYMSSGVLFDNALAVAGSDPVSPPNDIISSDGLPITIHFPKGAIRVGIQIDTDGYNLDRQPQIRFFDMNDNLLLTENFGQGPAFVGFEFPGILISKIQLGSTPYGDPNGPFGFSDAYDNLIFDLSVQGIDVSRHQGDIDWAEVHNAGYKFAFVKATEGVGYTDPNFIKNMNNGKSAGMRMGAYHFATPDLKKNDAKAEADYFISIAGDYLKGGYLRPALDVEKKNSCKNHKTNKVTLSEWVNEWMRTVNDATGVEPILYIDSSFANNCFDSSVTTRDLWIAHHTYDLGKPPNTGIWKDWVFWQYEIGNVGGIKKEVDLDIFIGDESELNNFVIK